MSTLRGKGSTPGNRLILASASPRRAELLTKAGIPFDVMISPSEEPESKPDLLPTEIWPSCLAYLKAAAVQRTLPRKARERRIILGADTIVVHKNRILNKPRNRTHARRMLSSLSGQTHTVITGICFLSNTSLRLTRAVATCRFARLSSARLTQYLDSNLWQGKAGAYGIQDIPGSDPFVTLVDGDITTVIGLPIPLVKRELASFASGG